MSSGRPSHDSLEQRRAVLVVPSLFTLLSLFFGIWSMVVASQGDFYGAGWYIFFGGILDARDGRVATLQDGDPVRGGAGQFGDLAAAGTAGPIVIANGDPGAPAHGERLRAIVPHGGAAGTK